MTEERVTVPLLDLKPQYLQIRDEVTDAIARVVEAQAFILGPEVDAFERECAEYCGSAAAVGVSSGTDALLLALMALRIGAGDEVVTSPYSFFATAGSIARTGAVPIFADIDPSTYNIDPAKLSGKLSPRTKAVMPVHLFGRCADVDAVRDAAGGLPLVEDAAQAIGAEYKGKRAGSLGTAGCFSFFPSKNLGAFGDAGLVTAADPELLERLRMLRVHGGIERYYHDEVGGNFRIDALQAAVLRVKLRRLEEWTRGRRENAEVYRRHFADAGLSREGAVYPDEEFPIVLPQDDREGRHIYNQFVVRAGRRDELQRYLGELGIGTAVYYPLSLHMQRCFAHLGGRGDFPESERAARETLALPIFPELSNKQLTTVVSRVLDFYRQKK